MLTLRTLEPPGLGTAVAEAGSGRASAGGGIVASGSVVVGDLYSESSCRTRALTRARAQALQVAYPFGGGGDVQLLGVQTDDDAAPRLPTGGCGCSCCPPFDEPLVPAGLPGGGGDGAGSGDDGAAAVMAARTVGRHIFADASKPDNKPQAANVLPSPMVCPRSVPLLRFSSSEMISSTASSQLSVQHESVQPASDWSRLARGQLGWEAGGCTWQRVEKTAPITTAR